MKSNIQLTMKFSLILLVGLMLSACGASKTTQRSGSVDLSSRGNPSTGDTGSSGGGTSLTGILTECNGINEEGLEGNLTTYYDPMSGQFLETYIRMTITKALAAMGTDSSSYVQIFRWYIDETNTRRVNETPTKLYFIQRGKGQAINRDTPATYLSGSMISGLISKYNLSGITASNFYDNFIVVLGDIGLTYDAITVAVYDSATNKAKKTIDILVPAFSADPNEYAITHPSGLLQNLHPNWSEREGGFTTHQYKSMAEQPCYL
ncbi:MAG: hypothetical protein KDD61_17955 [Bdellovibrionales bacterium]|nr:hypothetical protein [Bdellovibrionales bacterium]